MNNKKIAYVVKMFPRLSETFILNEIVELEKMGFNLHIFSSKYPSETIEHNKVKDVRSQTTHLPEFLGTEKLRILIAFLNVFLKFPGRTLKTFIRALKVKFFNSNSKSLIRFFQCCCIIKDMGECTHLHAHFATVPTRLVTLVNRITGMPYSISTHAKDIYLDNTLNSVSTINRLKNAEFVIANSNTSKADIINALGIEYENKVFTVYNGIDLNKFTYTPAVKTKNLILSVGRLEEKKGFDLLIKSCKKLIDKGISFECCIVGEGSKYKYLKQLISELNLKKHVKLVGALGHDDLIELYKSATMFVLPCRVLENGDRDVIPNVIKEAMAVGIPVITTSIPAMEEIIDDNKSGLLAPPENPDLLSKSIEKLFNDKALRLRLSFAARKKIEDRFNINNTIGRLSDLLLSLNDNLASPSPVIALEHKKLQRGLSNAIQ